MAHILITFARNRYKNSDQYSFQILEIYLRKVTEKEIPFGATSFYTAFDIAVAEFMAGRLEISEVENVGNAILNEADINMIFPTYAVCPTNYNPCSEIDENKLTICQQMKKFVQTICKQRF